MSTTLSTSQFGSRLRKSCWCNSARLLAIGWFCTLILIALTGAAMLWPQDAAYAQTTPGFDGAPENHDVSDNLVPLRRLEAILYGDRDIDEAVRLYSLSEYRSDEQVKTLIENMLARLNESVKATPLASSEDCSEIGVGAPDYFSSDGWLEMAFLSRIRQPWTSDDLENALRAELGCFLDNANIAAVLAATTDGQQKRTQVRLLENLLAWSAGNFRQAAEDAAPVDESDDARCQANRERWEQRKQLASDPHVMSRYSARSVVLSAYSAIAYANFASCPGEGADEADRLSVLEAQIDFIDKQFTSASTAFSQPIGAWRFVNDAVHYAVVISFLAGNKNHLKEFRGRFFSAKEQTAGVPLFNSKLNQDSRLLLLKDGDDFLIRNEEADLISAVLSSEYSDVFLPYRDSVYIYEHVPGDIRTRIRRQFGEFHLSLMHEELENSVDLETLSERIDALYEIQARYSEPFVDLYLYTDVIGDRIDLALSICEESALLVDDANAAKKALACSIDEYSVGGEVRARIGFANLLPERAEQLQDGLSNSSSAIIRKPTPLPTNY